MRSTLALCLLAALAACRTSNLGACSGDAQCPLGSTCDLAARVCLAKTGACLPACDATHVCNSTTLGCDLLPTPPVITLQTDGRTTFFGAGQTATVVAQIADATSPVIDATVQLLISGHTAVPGIAGASGTYSFRVLVDDSIVTAGASATLPFQIVASNKAGQQATLSADPAEVIQADRDAPSISAVGYAPAALAGPAGHLILGGAAGGSVAVQAAVSDGDGVVPQSVCLRLSGETGTCLHPGSKAGATSTWTFALPRPAAPQDGSTATGFTLEADDTLAASLSGASQAEHQARSPQTVYFDNGPIIAVSVDPAPYARTAVAIPVSALIAGGSGVPDGGVFLNGTLQPSSRDGGLFVFQLDPLKAPANVEGAYGFQVSATDSLGVSADAGGTRLIDDAAPDASVRVFKGTDPGTPGVTYPAAVAGTGWDGTQFIYNDTVQVNGTLADLSGLASAVLHIDYLQPDGGVSAGAPHPLGCASGAKTCTFSVPIALNAPGNGAFNTLTRTRAMGDILAPSDKLQVVIASTDAAKSADGTAAGHTVANSNDAQTTRLLWQMYLPASVSGLGVHPNGDLIVTLDGGTDTVVALRPDDGGVDWSFGGDAGAAGLGAVDGTPAIGSGDGGNARVYVAAESGEVYALEADGGAAWHNATGDTLNVGPAVFPATIATVPVEEVIVDGALNKQNSSLYGIAGGAQISSTAVADANDSSAPFIFNGKVYYGNASSIASHPLSSTGVLGAAATSSGLNQTNYFEVITDGTSLFAWRGGAMGIISTDPVFAFRWRATATPTGAPVVGLNNSSLIFSLLNGPVETYTTAIPGTNTLLLTLGGSGRAPLLGWDGTLAHLYFPRLSAGLFAYDTAGNPSWEADPNGATSTAYRAATMDCAGRLFGATNGLAGGKSLVYALITDDRGLAETNWPSYRRDARNTGNAGAPKYGIRTASGCTQ